MEELWEKRKNKISKKYNCILAIKEKKKGRVKREIIMAVKKVLEVKEFRTWSRQIAEIKVGLGWKIWRILTIYSQNIEETMKLIKAGIEERGEECLMLGEDLLER